MPILSSLLNLTQIPSSPFLSTLLPTIGLAYTLQTAAAIPSIYYQTERFYDLSGSLTYLSCTALSLYLPALRARAAVGAAGGEVGKLVAWPSLRASLVGRGGALGWDWRQVALSVAVGGWAVRLGTYLYSRITSSSGTDSRFDDIRTSPPKFAAAFFAQATWVTLCLLPVTALNSLPPVTFAALSATNNTIRITDILGLGLFAFGLGFEVTADQQMSRWLQGKRERKHDEEFMTRGLWSRSRHPNYFGEMTLWTGIAVAAGGVLARRAGLMGMGLLGSGSGSGSAFAGRTGGSSLVAARAMALAMAGVSPAFVAFLLLKVSGVPMSEKKYDEKFGHREDYRKWRRETPVLVPKVW